MQAVLELTTDQAGFKLLSARIKDPALVGPFKRAAFASGENPKRGQTMGGGGIEVKL